MSRRLLLLAAAAAACTEAPADPLRSGPAAPIKPADPHAVAFHMRMHFEDLRMIERFLVSGKLEESTALAGLLARPSTDPALAPFARDSSRVVAAAQELAKATSIDDALRLEVRVAAACADCHAAAKVSPLLGKVPPEPPAAPGAPARMARHAWAVDRLWEGVIGGDDFRWSIGLRVLASAPMTMAPLTDATPLGERLQHLAAAQLATRMTTDLDQRATAYGEMLVTCAACHASLRAIAVQP
ncbi:MAG TPA: hypothetical protein VGM88_25570 [Kofleriaceae bacterium]|jgi:cytochrome c553